VKFNIKGIMRHRISEDILLPDIVLITGIFDLKIAEIP
jgi:hypothetical protein